MALSPEELQKLQQKILSQRAEILESLQSEYEQKEYENSMKVIQGEIAEKLEAMRLELEGISKNLNAYHHTGNFPRLMHRNRKAGPLDPSTVRQIENPIFEQLEIPVPPGQRIGNELVPLGQKVKKNRKSRRTRRNRRSNRRV